MNKRVFRYKLDFYYQQAILYLATCILYAGIRGSFVEDTFNLVFKDPILYIIFFFVLLSLVVLVLNIWRGRKIVVTDDSIILQSRGREKIFPLKDIEWIYIGKERSVQTAGRHQLVALKFKGRSLAVRLRVGRYEKSRELVQEMERIAQHVPRRKHLQFGEFRKTDKRK